MEPPKITIQRRFSISDMLPMGLRRSAVTTVPAPMIMPISRPVSFRLSYMKIGIKTAKSAMEKDRVRMKPDRPISVLPILRPLR